jgi:hypothetical protein
LKRWNPVEPANDNVPRPDTVPPVRLQLLSAFNFVASLLQKVHHPMAEKRRQMGFAAMAKEG